MPIETYRIQKECPDCKNNTMFDTRKAYFCGKCNTEFPKENSNSEKLQTGTDINVETNTSMKKIEWYDGTYQPSADPASMTDCLEAKLGDLFAQVYTEFSFNGNSVRIFKMDENNRITKTLYNFPEGETMHSELNEREAMELAEKKLIELQEIKT